MRRNLGLDRMRVQNSALECFLRASPPNVFIRGPVPDLPGFPLKACGNDGWGKLIETECEI